MSMPLTERSAGFFIHDAYREQLSLLGLDSVQSVFDFQQGQSLTKANLSSWRQRIRFQLPNGEHVYLKRYHQPPKAVQLKAWLQHGQRAFLSGFDAGPVEVLDRAGIAVPLTIACGGEWGLLFERRSFIITLELPDAVSLEKQLPKCFSSNHDTARSKRNAFIKQLADFIRRFHATGYRHRDLYLCHIFLSDSGDLSLIDLHRCFRPRLLRQRYRIKDLGQLHYSAPAAAVSRTDRIRFYRAYCCRSKLTAADKACIGRIHAKAQRIARHDRRHGRVVPFEATRDAGGN